MPPGSPGTYDRATEWANGPAPGRSAGSRTSPTTSSARSTAHLHDPSRGPRDRRLLRRAPTRPSTRSSGTRTSFSVAEAWSGDFRQPPTTVGRDPALVAHFSALHTAPLRAGVLAAPARTSTSTPAARSRAAETLRSAQDLQRAPACTRAWTSPAAGTPGSSGDPPRRRPALRLGAPREARDEARRLPGSCLGRRAAAGWRPRFGLTDPLRGLPGPGLALALPLREAGHDGRASPARRRRLLWRSCSAFLPARSARAPAARPRRPGRAPSRSAGPLTLQAVCSSSSARPRSASTGKPPSPAGTNR